MHERPEHQPANAGDSVASDDDIERRTASRIPSVARLLQLGLVATSFLLLFASLLNNWFDIPATIELADSFEDVVRKPSRFQPWFQVVVLSGSLLLVWVYFFCRSRVPRVLVAVSIFFVTLTFPYFVMLRSPEQAADAVWLQMQHDNLTWLGGDIYSEAESGMNAWKSKIYWVDPPRQVAVAPLPTWALFEIGLDKIEDVLIWIGYANVFCQFVRVGWFAAVLGASLLVLVTIQRFNTVDIRAAGLGLLFFVALVAIGLGFALYGPFAAKKHLHRAAQATSLGDYRASLRELERCVELFPVLSQDSYYLSQRALLESKLDLPTDFAAMHEARQLESTGRYDRSFEVWSKLCESDAAAIRRESLRAVLRFAVQDYNSNRIELARQRLQFVLSRQPGNVKVIHYLQIISVREQDTATTYQMCDWMVRIADHLNFSTTKVLKASSQQNAKLAAALDGDAIETWQRMIEAK